ncbi:MAG: MFS transporter [Candidatus Obscuribacterales bacterium]|nr:MFS transporter [Candidatus Obscuribacterales bacterium]
MNPRSSPATTISPRISRDRLNLLLVANFSLVLLAGLNAGWIGPVLPAIASEQSIPIGHLGSLISLQFLGCIITLGLGKTVLDWLGIRNSMRLAATLWFCGLTVMAAGNGLLFLSLGSMLIGAGAGVNSIASTLCALQLNSDNSAGALNRLHVFFGVGALIGPFLALAMHWVGWSYHGTFFGGAALAGLIFSILLKTPNLETPDNPEPPPPTREVLSRWILWVYALVLFFYVGIESGFTAWLFTYLDTASHLSHSLASLGVSLFWIGLTVGRLLGGRLLSRFDNSIVTSAAMLLSFLGTMMLIIFPQPNHFCLLFVLLIGLGFGPIFPTVVALANMAFKSSAALVSTVVITIGFVGGVIFPWLAGHVFSLFGLQWGMSLMLIGSLAMLLLFQVSNKHPNIDVRI